MPSKLRKAIYAVKDQTSIGLAKVSSGGGPNASSLEVAILKATTHDDVPLEPRYVSDILQLISSNKSYAAAAAQAIAKRITKTRNWIVALKSLNLVLCIFQDGDPYFPREVLHAMKRGAKILNLSNFRDDSNSSAPDYTAFVRTFALYLDERLDCFLTGKLQKRLTTRHSQSDSHRSTRRFGEPIRDMKPAVLIDRVTYWQKLLDRAIATRPTGPAKSNRLVSHSLHAVVQESFDLYRDISDGLALLLDSFFHLQYQSCVNAFQACVKAAKQFEELGSFYDLCKSIGVGRTSEYPSVQQPSDELIETLQEFLKDQASFPCHGSRSPPTLPPASKLVDELEQSESSDKNSERGSDLNSVGDIMSATGSWTSPANSVEQDVETYSDYQSEKQSQLGDFFASVNDNESNTSPPNFTALFSDLTQENGKPYQEESQFGATSFRFGDWELVLAESATEPPQEWPDFFAATSIGDDLFVKPLSPQKHRNNPFLQDSEDLFAVPPTFKAESTEMAPTFRAQNSEVAVAPTFRAERGGFSSQNERNMLGFEFENDPFEGPWMNGNDRNFDGGMMMVMMNEESLLQQQKLWKEQQNKIIAKHSV